ATGQDDDVNEELYAQQRRIVRANALRFLERHIRHLWPRAVDKRGRFRWGVLVTPGKEEIPRGVYPEERKRRTARNDKGQSSSRRASATRDLLFDTQYWSANINPSDRYVLSLPGSIQYRLSPLDMTFDNMTIAGDWTASALDTGCIESAVMSGRLASHALSSQPRLEDIIGYDHP